MSDIDQDDIDLNYYEGVRKQIVTKLMKDGPPTDNEQLNTLLKAIDGGGRVILTKKRLAQDKEDNQTKGQTLAMVSEILRSVPTASQARQRTTELPSVEVVPTLPGETSIGTKEITYKEIMSNEGQDPS